MTSIGRGFSNRHHRHFAKAAHGTGFRSEPLRDRSATFNPAGDVNPEAERLLAALKSLAEQNERAGYDLGLRYFRGDGVRQDSYQARQWIWNAAERGHLKAQTAVGRLYLMGLEEMGSDPAEAEKWLSIAAGRGDKEASKLLAEASAAKKNEVAQRRWDLKGMAVPLPCRAHSGLHAGIVRWARRMLRELPISPPAPLPHWGEGRFASRQGNFHMNTSGTGAATAGTTTVTASY